MIGSPDDSVRAFALYWRSVQPARRAQKCTAREPVATHGTGLPARVALTSSFEVIGGLV